MAAARPRETPAACAASRARIASGSRAPTVAGLTTPPGTSRVPGRRTGSPEGLTGASANESATRSARCPAGLDLRRPPGVVGGVGAEPSRSQCLEDRSLGLRLGIGHRRERLEGAEVIRCGRLVRLLNSTDSSGVAVCTGGVGGAASSDQLMLAVGSAPSDGATPRGGATGCGVTDPECGPSSASVASLSTADELTGTGAERGASGWAWERSAGSALRAGAAAGSW